MFNKYELKEDSFERREKAEKVMSLLKYMHKSEIHLLEQDYDGGYDNEDLAYPFLEDDDQIVNKRKRVSIFLSCMPFKCLVHLQLWFVTENEQN